MAHKKHKMREDVYVATHHEGREGGKSWVDGHDEMVGRGDFANMPQGVEMRPFPKSGHYMDPPLDDTVVGIDNVMSGSERQTRKYLSNQK